MEREDKGCKSKGISLCIGCKKIEWVDKHVGKKEFEEGDRGIVTN